MARASSADSAVEVSNGAAGAGSPVEVSNGAAGAASLLTILDERDTEKCRIKAKAKAKGKDKDKADVQNDTPKKRCSYKQSTPDKRMQNKTRRIISARAHIHALRSSGHS